MRSLNQSFIHVSSEGGHIGRFHWRNSIGSLSIELYDENGELCMRDVTTLPGEFGFLETQFELDAWRMTDFDQYLPGLVHSLTPRMPRLVHFICRLMPFKRRIPHGSPQEDPELAAFRASLEGRQLSNQ